MAKRRKQEVPALVGPREAVFHPEFRDDLRYWVTTDRKVAIRILELVEAALRDPFTGLGKQEPMKQLLTGTWSRRITQEHRLLYLGSVVNNLANEPRPAKLGIAFSVLPGLRGR